MLRGALIGAGNAAMNGHLPAYLSDAWLRERMEIVAAADLSEGSLTMLQARMPSLRIHRSAAKLLAAEDVDLDFIDICAPPHTHPYLIRLASQRGCHILCEKPLAVDLTEGLEIQRCLAPRRIVFMPCHQYRFSPLWRAVSQLVYEDQIGHVHLAQLEVFRLCADPGSERWKADWRTDPRFGGGKFRAFSAGSHPKGAVDPLALGRFSGFVNRPGGLSRGVETYLDASPVKGMDLGATYTFTNSDRRVPGQGLLPEYVIPKHLFGLTLTQRYRALLFSFDLNRTGSYLAPVFENNFPFRMAELTFDGYTKGDVFASYERRQTERVTLVFFGGVENVFNERYYENGFLAPRAVGRAGVNVKF